MDMHIEVMLSAFLNFAALVVLGCRIMKMSHGTKETVFWQHALLATAIFASLLSLVLGFHTRALLCLSVGVVVFFAFSAMRWFHETPPGTDKAASSFTPTVPQGDLRSVSGGKMEPLP